MIFLSHSSEDDSFVNKLRTTLRKHGYKTWVDHRDIPAGKFWDDVVEEVLTQVDVMILVLSHAAVKSEYVAVEWREFKTTGKPLIPIRIEDCRPPLLIRHLQYLDFMDDSAFDEQFQLLLRDLPAPTLPVNTAEIEIHEDEFEVNRLRLVANTVYPALKGLLEDNKIVLYLPDFQESVVVDLVKEKVFIGWHDRENRIKPDVDLSHFIVADHGVSRHHAMISKNGSGITVTDLSSRNGTFIDRQQVKPEVPTVLGNKALLTLGKLSILVFVKE